MKEEGGEGGGVGGGGGEREVPFELPFLIHIRNTWVYVMKSAFLGVGEE